VEHFAFAAQPGRYAVAVTVTDSATGRVVRQTAVLNAFSVAPTASDLLLATALRQITAPGDTALRTGEIRKGEIVLQASGRPVLTPQQSRLGYYLELYAAQPETMTVTVRVLRPDGSLVIATAPQTVPIGAGGGATRGMVDLAGLPRGDYQLELAAGTDTGRVRRAPFGMAGFETEAALAAVPPADVRDRFAAMTEAQLDTVYMPLIYLMASDEQGIYPSLGVEAKREYLRQFWAKRDPTPGTPRNEEQEDFYRRISEAQRRYGEGGAGRIPGWRTDRGRVFIKYGAPDDVLSRPQAGATGPYEVWKYTRVRALKYVFLDQTGFGNFALIWTDDRRELSRANWRDLLGREAVLDVERF
jgi:GWxTD domain-containing protein